MEDDFNGDERREAIRRSEKERRSDYCPVHHIKCEQWSETARDVKSRVPIWIFKISIVITVTVLGTILGYMNFTSLNQNRTVLVALNTHMSHSNIVFSRVTHALNEVALNQRTVMKVLDIEFQNIPDVGEDDATHYE